MKKYICYGIIVLIFAVFCGRLVVIRSSRNFYMSKLEEKTKIYVEGFSAPRGRILDTNGKVLVDNQGVRTIYYNKIKGVSRLDEVSIAKCLASILTIDDANIDELKEYYLVLNNDGDDLIKDSEYELVEKRKLSTDEIKKLKLERITSDMINYSKKEKKAAHIYALMNKGYVYSKKEILKNVSEEEYALVLEENISGVTGELSWERVYPYKDTLRNVLGRIGSIKKEEKEKYLKKGYLLSDIVGISYLEEEYEEYLRGQKAKYKVNSDYTLTKISEEKRGNDLVLSIDIDLQMRVDSILEDKILLGKKYKNTEYYRESYAIVSDPLTGFVLALSGKRLNTDGTFSDVSLNNINKSFTIGSAVKGATIGVGYKYNLITPGEYITDACVKLKNVPQKCSFKSLGKVNDLTALANSSNYYQYLIAIKLTGNLYKRDMVLNATDKHFKIYREMLSSFGLGVKTGIDLPNEQIGIIGSKVADDLLLNLAIGQYDTYTPIEVAQYINSVATGNRLKINLLKEVRNNDEVVLEKNPTILNKVDLDNESLERIKEGLKLVLSEGTGTYYVPRGLDFAGKTGTSESFLDTDNDLIVDTATLSSTFTGFYPTDNPKYSLVVITPNISHKNGSTDTFYFGASKITKDIIKYLENT